ncbi:btb/poz domain-containing protein [Anaeramoeba flamelloides]|uniref:Btb/poz domain-containing protein n=1 Tax=Anaeramoeba flamelloides TaxID=1746091 RepID=A0AAV7ZMQ8_9EUKA|nr:btb/poz domain-containing protein [Anaeramoeba flamelloides]
MSALELHELTKGLFNQKDFSNVEFVIGDSKKRLYGHKIILSQKSAFFKDIFYRMDWQRSTKQITTVIISDTRYDPFRIVLQYLYSIEIKLTYELAWCVISIAKRFQLVELFDYCCAYLKERITIRNCLEVFKQCVQNKYDKLLKSATHFIQFYIDQIQEIEGVLCSFEENFLIYMIGFISLSKFKPVLLLKRLIEWCISQFHSDQGNSNTNENHIKNQNINFNPKKNGNKNENKNKNKYKNKNTKKNKKQKHKISSWELDPSLIILKLRPMLIRLHSNCQFLVKEKKTTLTQKEMHEAIESIICEYTQIKQEQQQKQSKQMGSKMYHKAIDYLKTNHHNSLNFKTGSAKKRNSALTTNTTNQELGKQLDDNPILACQHKRASPSFPKIIFDVNLTRNVLLISTDSFNKHIEDVKNSIKKYSKHKIKLDFFNAHQGVPTLEKLLNYHVVFLYSSIESFKDSKLTGDNLAKFSDNGGGVVISSYRALVSNPKKYKQSELFGEIVSKDYLPVTKGVLIDNRAHLSDVLDNEHPLTYKVNKFDGGMLSYRIKTELTTVNQENFETQICRKIALWDDGNPLIAIREKPSSGGKVIVLNFWPVCGDCYGYKGKYNYWRSFSHGKRIISNCVNYAACNNNVF